jgi:hypothetical protein
MLRRRRSVLFGLVFRMNLSVSRCVYIGPSALALGLGWTRRFAVYMRSRLQQCSQNPAIVRLYCLSRPLQAPPKTSADLGSEVSSSANQPHLPGLNIPVGATGRAVFGNARAPSSLKVDIPLLRGESYLFVPFVRLSVLFTSGHPEAPILATCKLHASVRRVAAIVDRAKSVRLDRTPIPAVCSLHTCQAHTYVQYYCKSNCFRRTYKSLSV